MSLLAVHAGRRDEEGLCDGAMLWNGAKLYGVGRRLGLASACICTAGRERRGGNSPSRFGSTVQMNRKRLRN